MATADNTTKEKKMSKTVNIVAYIKADSSLDKREMMATVDSEGDYDAMRTSKLDRFYLVTDEGVNRIEETTYERLKSIESDDMMVCEAPKVTERPKRGSSAFTSVIKNAATDGTDLKPPGSDMDEFLGYKVKDNGRTLFSVRCDGPAKMGLLKHPSKVENPDEDGVWDDPDADLWTVTVTCKVDGVDPTTYRWFDNNVIPEIKQKVARHDWVGRTRVMDCSKEMTEEGACYDMF